MRFSHRAPRAPSARTSWWSTTVVCHPAVLADLVPFEFEHDGVRLAIDRSRRSRGTLVPASARFEVTCRRGRRRGRGFLDVTVVSPSAAQLDLALPVEVLDARSGHALLDALRLHVERDVAGAVAFTGRTRRGNHGHPRAPGAARARLARP